MLAFSGGGKTGVPQERAPGFGCEVRAMLTDESSNGVVIMLKSN